ncbi:MAG: hypothetical protein ACUVWX_12605, partial [Kiritimatiellia bacterium]
MHFRKPAFAACETFTRGGVCITHRNQPVLAQLMDGLVQTRVVRCVERYQDNSPVRSDALLRGIHAHD